MTNVTVLYAQWCHSCPSAKLFWNRLLEERSFEYEEIDIDTPRGSELAKIHNLTSVPATLINGRPYFVGTPERERAITILKSLE